MAVEGPDPAVRSISLRQASKVWAYIGLNSFGGPAGQIAVMHRELIDQRRWISERRFLHSLNFCMILPGPEAQQLAIYLGWLMHGVSGGVVAGSLFVLPGMLIMLVVATGYALFGSITWVAGLLFGVQSAVVAIVVQALIRIGRRTTGTRLLVIIASASFMAIFFLGIPFPLIVLAAGLLGWLLGRARPEWFQGGQTNDQNHTQVPTPMLADDSVVDRTTNRRAFRAGIICAIIWLVPVAILVLTLGRSNIFAQEALLFSTSAVVTFGGAYAVLGYVTQQAVDRYGWIGTQDMMVGLGLAETTPGPLILVVEFVGFLAAYNQPGNLPPLIAGTLGALLTIWVTFVPCFMFIFLGAPYIEKLRHNRSISHALTAVGAAVSGVIANLAMWFALNTAFATIHTLTLGPIHIMVPELSSIRLASVAICLLAFVLVFRFKLATLKVLAVSAVAGAALTLAGLT